MEQRYIFTLLAFIGNMINMFGRDSLRIGVLAIRAEYETCLQNTSSLLVLRPTNLSTECGPIVWDDGSVAQLLGSFNYGMVLTMLVGGPVADMVGGKYVLLLTTLVSSLSCLVLPLLVASSLPLLLASQLVYGMSGGLVVPALSSMIARWEPLSERGRLATLIYSGSQASAVGTAVFSGIVMHSLDWRLVFLLLGSLPLLWLLPWLCLVSDSPLQRRGISQEELHLLLAETATSCSRPRLRDIPVRSILCSGPVWGAVLGNAGVAWAAAHTSLLLPQYLAGELHLPLHHTGVAAALPYLGCCLAGLLSSLLYSWLVRARGLAPTTARKLCSSLCLWGFALLCLPLSLLPSDPFLVTLLSSASYSLMGFNLVGAWSAPQDMAPNYVATVMGLVGLVSYLVTALVPHTLGLAASLLPPQQVWPGLFLLVAAVAFLANLAFLGLGSSQLQSWNWCRDQGSQVEEEGRTWASGGKGRLVRV